MNNTEPGEYEIRLRGLLPERFTAWFDGLNVRPQTDGTTVIRGTVADQAALHGWLQRVRDLGIPLISVVRVTDATTDPRTDTERNST